MSNHIITDISDFIFISDEPERVDAIFLPGGSHPEQPEYAAQLYRGGFAKWLVPAGGISIKRDKWPGVRSKSDIYNGDYQSDCEFFTDVLLKNGVPSSAVICEDKSRHTHDNAFLSRKVIDEKGIQIKTALIVCKAFHARRCLMLYQIAFPDVKIKVCPVHCYNITKDNWYKSEKGIDRVLGEVSRCGNQFVGDIKQYITAGLEA
ncbi:YdcF family protein [Ruminococcus sp. Marseille-P6503]|uniref:YdcF family protein n=1 Tax=Ruminococcus sp. Marseille-P6503 TaxID=2364796 RepID=UPI000F5448FA|nr:YdcF family protein [Ruminococcus sp. Marseille-P6503]